MKNTDMKNADIGFVVIFILVVSVVLCFLFGIYKVKTNSLEMKNINHEKMISDLNQIIKTSNQNKILYKEKLKEIVNELSFKIDPSLTETIVVEAIKNKDVLDPVFTICIIAAESSFRPDVKNSYGAIGLMQVVPKFHEKLMQKLGIHPLSLYHVDNNIKVGTRILRQYLDKYEDINKVMQKYCGASNQKNTKKYLDKIVPKYVYYKLKYGII